MLNMFDMNDPGILEMLRLYQQPSYSTISQNQFNPILGDTSLFPPISQNQFNPILGNDAPFRQEQLVTQPGITKQKTPWGDYAMYAALGAAPVANLILSNRRPQAQLASAPSLGSKPNIDMQNFYALFKGKGVGANSILARLLRNR